MSSLHGAPTPIASALRQTRLTDADQSEQVFSLLLVTALVQSLCTAVDAGEGAATAYRSRYMLSGFLTRAAAVCAADKRNFKHFLDAGLRVLGTPELRAVSKAYPSTTGQWMKDGAETFNSRVMSDSIGPACAYAITENHKASDPLLGQ